MSTTVKELYNIAKVLLFEKNNSTDYNGYYIGHINTLLADNYELNNGLRVQSGLSKLDSIPSISKDSDIIPYEDIVTRLIIPYGLASKLAKDDDMSIADWFDVEYKNARSSHTVLNEVSVTDCYGGYCD